ncbi:winged helix-turn-helix domain-containing protein [Streptomyces rishiriensis]|uniref:winged helix-turn-helix domain-containing protein n=1 Tax=Streptomyces rishiriensis TaxID=68264 RepID=UPI0033D23BCD
MIAKDLRVSVRSVKRWRRARREGGMEALRSAGPANSPTVTDAQFAVLEEELGKGPSAHGFEDERWTLARVQAVIRRRLRVSLSVATVWRLLKRHGWSWQAPARRALSGTSTRWGCGREEPGPATATESPRLVRRTGAPHCVWLVDDLLPRFQHHRYRDDLGIDVCRVSCRPVA